MLSNLFKNLLIFCLQYKVFIFGLLKYEFDKVIKERKWEKMTLVCYKSREKMSFVLLQVESEDYINIRRRYRRDIDTKHNWSKKISIRHKHMRRTIARTYEISPVRDEDVASSVQQTEKHSNNGNWHQISSNDVRVWTLAIGCWLKLSGNDDVVNSSFPKHV